MRSIVFGQSRTSFVCLWKEFFRRDRWISSRAPWGGRKEGVMYPIIAPRINGSSLRFWRFYTAHLQSLASQLSCNNMACILRIFCGCLQDKMHCLELYSSPREWAEFPTGTKVQFNKQVLTINFSQPQCYVFKMRRLKSVLGRVSLSNSPIGQTMSNVLWINALSMC